MPNYEYINELLDLPTEDLFHLVEKVITNCRLEDLITLSGEETKEELIDIIDTCERITGLNVSAI